MTSLSGFGAFDSLARTASPAPAAAMGPAAAARQWFDAVPEATTQQPLRGEVEPAARGLDAAGHAQRVLACLVVDHAAL